MNTDAGGASASNAGLGRMPEQTIRDLVNGLNGLQPMLGQWQRDLRLARAVEAAAVAAERARLAKLCVERAQLSWAAADHPYAPEVKMRHEAVAAAMEELAGELRA